MQSRRILFSVLEAAGLVRRTAPLQQQQGPRLGLPATQRGWAHSFGEKRGCEEAFDFDATKRDSDLFVVSLVAVKRQQNVPSVAQYFDEATCLVWGLRAAEKASKKGCEDDHALNAAFQ